MPGIPRQEDIDLDNMTLEAALVENISEKDRSMENITSRRQSSDEFKPFNVDYKLEFKYKTWGWRRLLRNCMLLPGAHKPDRHASEQIC